MSKTQQKTEEKQKKEELCLKLFESQVVQKFKSTSFNDTHEKLLKFYCFCYFYSSLVHLKKAQIIKKSYIHEEDNEIILKHLRFQALLEYRMTFECALKSDNIFSVDTTKKYNIFSITRGLFSHDTKKLSNKASSYTQFFSQKTQQIKGYKKNWFFRTRTLGRFFGEFFYFGPSGNRRKICL